MTLDVLKYVKNTGGNASWYDFVDDWQPIGHQLFKELEDAELIGQDEENGVYLTSKGEEKLKELESQRKPNPTDDSR